MSQSVDLEEDCKGLGCHLGQGLYIIAISIEIKEKPYSISYLIMRSLYLANESNSKYKFRETLYSYLYKSI